MTETPHHETPLPIETSARRRAILTLSTIRVPTTVVLAAAADVCGVTQGQIKAKNRGYGAVIKARMIYYWLASAMSGVSSDRIASSCGGRHHSTVVKVIQSIVGTQDVLEPQLSAAYALLIHRGNPSPVPMPKHGRKTASTRPADDFQWGVQ